MELWDLLFFPYQWRFSSLGKSSFSTGFRIFIQGFAVFSPCKTIKLREQSRMRASWSSIFIYYSNISNLLIYNMYIYAVYLSIIYLHTHIGKSQNGKHPASCPKFETFWYGFPEMGWYQKWTRRNCGSYIWSLTQIKNIWEFHRALGISCYDWKSVTLVISPRCLGFSNLTELLSRLYIPLYPLILYHCGFNNIIVYLPNKPPCLVLDLVKAWGARWNVFY